MILVHIHGIVSQRDGHKTLVCFTLSFMINKMMKSWLSKSGGYSLLGANRYLNNVLLVTKLG